ncbi:MAG: hypothetical protein IPL73_12995 [Candidatus Obscuribacter sp.]|nr:hypothetical protein [Candidatus Obscuribacter sp.]
MKESKSNSLFVASLLSLYLAASTLPVLALDKPMPPPAAAVSQPRVQEMASMTVPALAPLASQYKENPDENSWNQYFNLFKEVLANPAFSQVDSQLMIQSNPSMQEFRAKAQELPGAGRVWSFLGPKESHTAIFQSSQGRVFLIPMPALTALRDARFVSYVPATPAPGKPAHKPVVSPAPAATSKYLAFIGGDRATGNLWFKGYKIDNGALFEAPEVFASLPPFFTQSVSGKASFAGNDIVLTILPAVTSDPYKSSEVKTEKPKAAAVGYRVTLKFVGNHYTLAGKQPEEGPHAVALVFARALAAGRTEIAKSWLIDPKLICIPKYLGLIGRDSPPMRLVPMTSTVFGGSRFRLVTGAKDDLIIEVGVITQPGRLKGKTAVKGIFVAPPDALAQKITGTIIMPQVVAPPPATAGDAAHKPESAKPVTKSKAH